VDNGGDELTQALQALIAQRSTQCSRACRSQRTSCYMLRTAQCKRPESGRFVNARAGQC
jgi:hypothetical protein